MARKEYRITIRMKGTHDMDGVYELVNTLDTKEEAVERLRTFFTQLRCELNAGISVN